MKNFYIHEMCTQNWDDMPKTQNGTYCSQCSMEVYDFTNKTPDDIRKMLHKFKNERLCTRMTRDQEAQLNRDFETWKLSTNKHMQRATFFTFLLVFGLTFISCSVESDKEQISQVRDQALEVINSKMNSSFEEIKITNPTTDFNQTTAEDVETIEYYYPIEMESILQASLDTVYLTKEDIASMPEREYVLGGAVVQCVEYIDYLDQVVPEKEKRYDKNGVLIPDEFGLTAYPNPTSGPTSLKLEVPNDEQIQISVLNMTGQVIRDFGQKKYDSGTHELHLDLTDHPAGMYMVVVQSQSFEKITRISKQ